MSLRMTVGEARRISPPGRRHWFPRLFYLPNGSLLQFNAIVDDETNALTKTNASAGRLSHDGGCTWHEFPMPARYGFPVALADGGVRSFSYLQWREGDGQIAGRYSDWEANRGVWLPEETYLIHSLPTAERPSAATVGGLALDRTVLCEADGTLLATLYGRLAGQEKYTCLLVRSPDAGRNWHFVSTIAYAADISGEGFCEPVLARVADGSLLVLMRTGGGMARNYPIYQARSLDNGLTWSAPQNLGIYSVDPDLCLLSNGLLACSFGRPTLEIMVSPDGSGYSWQRPTTVFSGNSTCYSGLRQVAANRLLLVYDSNSAGTPWQADDNQINAVFIEVVVSSQ